MQNEIRLTMIWWFAWYLSSWMMDGSETANESSRNVKIQLQKI